MFFFVEPATLVFGRLAESGIAFRALAVTVILFVGIGWCWFPLLIFVFWLGRFREVGPAAFHFGQHLTSRRMIIR